MEVGCPWSSTRTDVFVSRAKYKVSGFALRECLVKLSNQGTGRWTTQQRKELLRSSGMAAKDGSPGGWDGVSGAFAWPTPTNGPQVALRDLT